MNIADKKVKCSFGNLGTKWLSDEYGDRVSYALQGYNGNNNIFYADKRAYHKVFLIKEL